MITIIELVLSLAAILGAAVLFTNAVEMLGERLNLGSGAVGSLLAAVGTALPETMIPVVALIAAALAGESAGGVASEIGIGAILGAPFLLTTLAMFVVGVSILGFRRRRENGTELIINQRVARRDIAFFFVCFAVAAGAGVVSLPTFVRVIVGILLVGAYAFYVWRTIVAGGEGIETPDNLTIWPESSWGRAPTWAVVAQLIAALAVMIGGARFFVQAVEHMSSSLGVPAGLISLVLAPLATELPEKFNSVIWLREDKDTLAIGNISGAMVFQSTLPVTLGLLFTQWQLGFINTFSVILALLSGVGLFVLLLRKGPIKAWYLLGGGVFYAVFLAVAVYQLVY
ncbi:MAG: sodium:calcium antiporter [Actinomycetota bacterium]|nr:sodium:calcium antiporter [Actinomycetota bacterium]